MALLRLALLVLLSVAGFQGAAETTASNFGGLAAESSDSNREIDARRGIPVSVLPPDTGRAFGFVTHRLGSHAYRARAEGFPAAVPPSDIELPPFAPAARILPTAETKSFPNIRRAFDSRGPPRSV
jgi:hypothetical protein